MTPAERAAALAGIEALQAGALAIPAAAPFAELALGIAHDIIGAGHDDPAAILKEAREQLKSSVAFAMRAKFPNG